MDVLLHETEQKDEAMKRSHTDFHVLLSEYTRRKEDIQRLEANLKTLNQEYNHKQEELIPLQEKYKTLWEKEINRDECDNDEDAMNAFQKIMDYYDAISSKQDELITRHADIKEKIKKIIDMRSDLRAIGEAIENKGEDVHTQYTDVTRKQAEAMAKAEEMKKYWHVITALDSAVDTEEKKNWQTELEELLTSDNELDELWEVLGDLSPEGGDSGNTA